MACKVKYIASGKTFDKDEIENHIKDYLATAKKVPEEATFKTPLERAKDLVNSDVVKGFSAEPLKVAANQEDQSEFNGMLREIAQQAHDPNSEQTTIHTFGPELVNIAKELHPEHSVIGNMPVPTEETIIPSEKGAGKVPPVEIAGTEVGEHGEDTHTAQQIENGTKPTDLTAKGKQQALDLGAYVVEKGRNEIVSSEVERAKQTAQVAAEESERLGNPVKLSTKKDLNTWDIGDFDGKPVGSFDESHYVNNPNERVPGGESFNEFKGRMEQAYQMTKDMPKTSQLIAHSKVLRALRSLEPTDGKWTDETTQRFEKWHEVEKDQQSAKALQGSYDRLAEQMRSDGKNPEEDEGLQKMKESINNLNKKAQENASNLRGHPRQSHGSGDTSESSQDESSKNLQLDEEAKTKPPEAEQSTGSEQPPEAPGGNVEDLPFGKLPVGIAHQLRVDRSRTEFNISAPERGKGISIEDSIDRGKELLKAGVNPQEVANAFLKDNRLSHDDMAVVRARYNELANETNDAVDKYGENSDQAKKAAQAENDWYDKVVKPMQTESSKVFTAQQAAVDLGVGTVTSLKRAFKDVSGKPLTEKQSEKAKDLHATIKQHEKTIKEQAEKLDKLQHPSDQPANKTYTEKAKAVADKLRQFKNKPFSFKDENGNEIPIHKAGLDWNDIIEFGAKAVEKTGQIADGIAAIIDKVKDVDWYKGLSKDDKERFEKELQDHYTGIADKKAASRIKALEKQLADLKEGKVKYKTNRTPTDEEQNLKDQIFEEKNKLGLIKSKVTTTPKTPIENQKIDISTHFIDKKGNDFTPEESAAIWDHTKGVIDSGNIDLHNVISQVANDTGLTAEQVRRAIAQPKGAKVITDKMYASMYRRNQVLQSARIWVKSADQSAAKKFWTKVIKVPSAIVTALHGSVAPITHVGGDLYRPSNWKSYFNFMIDSYKYSFGGTTNAGKARYEKDMADLVKDPMFPLAKRAGLRVDPTDLNSDDYSNYQSVFGRLAKMGERGFNAMKPYRLEQFKKLYNGLSDDAKGNPDVLKAVAHIVNLQSGTTEAKIPPGTDLVMFAPKLVLSQYQRIFTEPAKAVGTFVNWGKSSDAQKVQAKMVARHSGEMITTYIAGLAANQAILSLTGSKQNINFTNPLDPDWMKFKVGDKVVDASGGMNSALRFVASLVEEAARANGIIKTTEKSKPGDTEKRKIVQQAENKLSPIAGDIVEASSGTDNAGNPLPWSSIKPTKGHPRETWTEYFASKSPIFMSEGFKSFEDAAKENGMDNATMNNYLEGVLIGVLSGATGAKIGPAEYKSKKTNDAGGYSKYQ